MSHKNVCPGSMSFHANEFSSLTAKQKKSCNSLKQFRGIKAMVRILKHINCPHRLFVLIYILSTGIQHFSRSKVSSVDQLMK